MYEVPQEPATAEINMTGMNGDILFRVRGQNPVLALKENGDIEVKGKKVENDKELVEALREWMKGAKSAPIEESVLDLDFDEDELAEIAERARRQALISKNWLWVEAYKNFSMAADRLHAMVRRSEEDAPEYTKDSV
jgi:hypothetical protein